MPSRPLAIASYVAVPVLAIALLTSANLLPGVAVPARAILPQERIDAASRTPVGMVVNWARTVMASQHEPGSVVWDQLLASQDGSVVCLAYRARSKAGILASERVSFIVGSAGAQRADWAESCTRGVVTVADAEKWIAVR